MPSHHRLPPSAPPGVICLDRCHKVSAGDCVRNGDDKKNDQGPDGGVHRACDACINRPGYSEAGERYGHEEGDHPGKIMTSESKPKNHSVRKELESWMTKTHPQRSRAYGKLYSIANLSERLATRPTLPFFGYR